MKKKSKISIISIFLIIILVLISIILANKSYKLKSFESLSYKETIATNYKVYLKDNSYYNTQYLNEDMQYISNIIDYVDVTFSYITNFADILDYNAKTRAEAVITIVDPDDNNKVIYTSTEVLDKISENSDTGNTINAVKNYKINFDKYNKITNEFKTKYSISAKCNLKINYYIDYTGKYKGLDNVSKSTLMYLNIPLSEQMVNISKNAPEINIKSFNGLSSNTTTNLILYAISLGCALIAVILLVRMIAKEISRRNKISKYDKFISKVLKQYDSYITEAEKETDFKENSIKISTFNELLDVRNNVNKTIVYIKIDEDTSKFEIIDNNTLYYFIAKRSDF